MKFKATVECVAEMNSERSRVSGHMRAERQGQYTSDLAFSFEVPAYRGWKYHLGQELKITVEK